MDNQLIISGGLIEAPKKKKPNWRKLFWIVAILLCIGLMIYKFYTL